jgi:DNA polymerase-1
MPRHRFRYLLVDAEIIAHKVCSECLQEEMVNKDEWTFTLDEREARRNFAARVDSARREVGGAERVVVAVGRKPYWRTRVWREYKAGRAERRNPLGYLALLSWACKEWDCAMGEGLEADDVLGIWHTLKTDSVVVSNDKDMRTVPGALYNFDVPQPRVESITEEQADMNHLVLALSGDPGDGYPGAKGVGPVTAGRELAAVPRMARLAKALELFERAGHDRKHANTMLCLARVLRHGDYDEATQEVRMFTGDSLSAAPLVRGGDGGPGRGGVARRARRVVGRR